MYATFFCIFWLYIYYSFFYVDFWIFGVAFGVADHIVCSVNKYFSGHIENKNERCYPPILIVMNW